MEQENGYVWQGMKKITKEEALNRFDQKLEVFRLYDDNTEGLVESLDQIEDENFSDFDFGYGLKESK